MNIKAYLISKDYIAEDNRVLTTKSHTSRNLGVSTEAYIPQEISSELHNKIKRRLGLWSSK